MHLSALITFIMLSVTSFHSLAYETWRPWIYQSWDLQTESRYYTALANYTDKGGSFDRLNPGHSYQLFTQDLRARYVLTRSWSIWAGMQFAYAESKNTQTTRTNSAVTQIDMHLERLLSRQRSYDLIADLYFRMPLERVKASEDKVIANEGAMEAGAQLLARARWGWFRPFVSLGFTHRDEGRSALLPYSAGAELRMGKSYLGADIKGSYSLSKDDYTDTPNVRKDLADRNGGSLKFNGINPNLTEAGFWWRKQPRFGLGIKLFADISVTGASAAHGWSLGAALNYRFAVEKPVVSSEPQKFEIPTEDGVDQGLFEEDLPKP